jgi:hypothetical protein
MILNLPTWIPGKAKRYVWYKHTTICFALPSANPQQADRLSRSCYFNKYLHFKKRLFPDFIHHLHCAISGPG